MARPRRTQPPNRQTKRKRTSVSRRPQADRWSEDEILNDLEARASAATRPRRTTCRGHVVSIAQGAVLASRRVLAARYHRSASGIQKILTSFEREGRGRLTVGKCGAFCHRRRHEHTSTFTFHKFAAPDKCAQIISRAVARAVLNSLTQHPERNECTVTTKTNNCSWDGASALNLLRENFSLGPHDEAAVRRLGERLAPTSTDIRSLKTALAFSGFLQGTRSGSLGRRFTGLTVAWIADHAEAVMAGKFSDWNRPEPAIRPPVPGYRLTPVCTIGEFMTYGRRALRPGFRSAVRAA